jgi:hypothetical protein
MVQFNVKRLINTLPLFSAKLRETNDVPDDDASTIKDHRIPSIDGSLFDYLNFSENHPHELDLPPRPSSTWPDGNNILDLSSFSGYVPLVTHNIGFIYRRMEYSDQQTAHLVIGLIQSPGAMMGVGMKISTRGVKGELTEVFDLVDEGVRFVCQRDNGEPFTLLQIEYEYAKLPFLWKMKSFCHRVRQEKKKWCKK